MKKTVRVPIVSIRPVLQSCGILFYPGSRKKSQNLMSKKDENGLDSAMRVPVYQMAQKPTPPSVGFCYQWPVISIGHTCVFLGILSTLIRSN